MWISTKDSHPPLGERHRAEGVWLYAPSRGIFLGAYVEFGLDEPVDDHEYSDGSGRCYPSHFWTGLEEPEHSPRV